MDPAPIPCPPKPHRIRLTAREELSVPVAVTERKPMKYGRLELQARLAFLFTFLYTSSYPEASEKQNKKPNPKNNQIKQNKIKLSIERWSSWPQREKGKCSLTLPLLTSSALPRWKVPMDGHEDLASGFWPAAQRVGPWTQLGRGIRWKRRERNSFP